MAKFEVIIQSEDEQILKMCSEYWERKLTESGYYRWTYYVRELHEKYGLSQSNYLEIVQQKSYAFTDKAKECDKCGTLHPTFNNRGDLHFETLSFNRAITDQYLCNQCFEAALTARKEQQRISCQNDIDQYLATIVNSYENNAYESLNSLEFRYLLELAKSKQKKIANQVVGISSSDSEKILDKLDNKKLINNRYFNLPLIPDHIAEKLSALTITQKVKTVFGSEKEKEIYRILKGQFLPVFPQMAVSTFIPKETVQHLFTKEWHNEYYKSCRVDLVVLEHQSFIPQYVIEYQGGSHEEKTSAHRDEFKKMIIQETGLNVIYIDSKKLNQLKVKGEDVKFPEDFINDF